MCSGERLFFRKVHLAVENVETLNPDLCRLINYSFDGHFFSFEMPIGISGYAELCALFARGSRPFRFIVFGGKGERGAETGGAGEE